MSLNNNLLRGKGFVQSDKHTRPQKNNPIGATNSQITSDLNKYSQTMSTKCPDGTKWHKKLMQCIPDSSIELLKKRKGDNHDKMTRRSTIREALLKYAEIDNAPN